MQSKLFVITLLALLCRAFFNQLYAAELNIESKAHDKMWLRLLHAEKTITGSYHSQATSPEFFLSPTGRQSPLEELKELINQVSRNDIPSEKHPVCRFPARVHWLKKHFPEINIAQMSCPLLEEFKKRTSSKSASVVFSSYYLNNPSSSFGHTFLRLGRDEVLNDQASTNLELLDTGINYGAMTGDAGILLYFFGGLSGYFQGSFASIPYYYKVREYNDYETRDLWTYHLNLTPEEVEQLVNHVWELGHTTFTYYFLTKNCSYYVLSMIDAVKEDAHLVEKIPTLYTIPTDTLRILKESGLVKKITFRPSSRTQFYQLEGKLNPEHKHLVLDLIKNPTTDLSLLTEETKVKVLDTSISLIDYKFAKQVLKKDEEIQNIKRPLLVKRARIPIASPTEEYSEITKLTPDESHASNRLLIGLGYSQKNDHFVDLDWRFALQDLLDNDDGYPSFTKIEIARIKARLQSESQVNVKELTFLDAYSLGSWDQYSFSAAWNLQSGIWESHYDYKNIHGIGMKGGYGLGKEFNKHNLFFLPHLEGSYLYEKDPRLKIAWGFDTGLALRLNTHLKFVTKYEWRNHPWQETLIENELRWANRSWGAGIKNAYNFSLKENEFALNILKYF